MDSLPNESGIYKITCTSNGKIYIGSAKSIVRRWAVHRCELRKDKHKCGYLQNAFNKYGEDAFVIIVVELCPIERLIEREQYWLDELKPYDHSIGFNINRNASSRLGMKHTPESLAKMSAGNKGKKHTDEWKREQSLRGLNRKHSPESKAKMSMIAKQRTSEQIEKAATARRGILASETAKYNQSLAAKKRYEEGRGSPTVMTGRVVSDAAKVKMSAAKLGKKQSEEHKLNSSIAMKKWWAERKQASNEQ